VTKYLTTKRVKRINQLIKGESSVVRDFSSLDSAVARPQASAFGEDAYPTVLEKAAAMFHSLVLNHPFVDGNKRTATVALIRFLRENGFNPRWNTEEAMEFIIEVAEGKHNVPAIVAWLSANTEAQS